jgi:hypothetical protein
LTNLCDGHDVASDEKEARQVFLGCENDPRALCFHALLGDAFDDIRPAADLGDALAQAEMTWRMVKSAFGGRKNLPDKENATVSCGLDVAIEVEQDA